METWPDFSEMWRGLVSKVAELERQTLGVGKLLAEQADAAAAQAEVNAAQAQLLADALANPEASHYVGAAGEPGFQSDWSNNDVGYSLASFYKDEAGTVHGAGMVRKASGVGANGSTIFNFPPDYRPSRAHFHLGLITHTGAASAATGYAIVYPDGNVVAFTTDTTAALLIFQLDELTFRT